MNVGSASLRTLPSGSIRLLKGPILFFVLVSLHVLLFTGVSAHAAQVTLSWANTDPGVAGYKLYYGTVSGSYPYNVNAGNTTSYALSGLSTGATYYFVATAYDSEGYESEYSNQISYTVPSPCTYSIAPTAIQFSPSASGGSVTVTTQSGCAWTASSAAQWVLITSGGSGSGSGIVRYSVAVNAHSSPRTEVSTIAGLPFTVSQAPYGANHNWQIAQ